MRHPLKKPITIGKITIDSLNFRDYTTAADYLAFDKHGGVAQRIALIASLTGTDTSLIEQLSGVDYKKAVEIADKILEQDDEPESETQGLDEETEEQKEARTTAEKK